LNQEGLADRSSQPHEEGRKRFFLKKEAKTFAN
jgi:hypothetical protein